jgi:hydroxymethylpyrimidine/phosphomethylpyrimidine kinase
VTVPVVLVIAGWDPSGAAGLAQDLKVLSALGVHACGAPAALTVQGRDGALEVQGVDAALLARQLKVLLQEQPVAAVKLGLLHGEAQVAAVAQALALFPRLPVVLDPVLGASAGGSLVSEACVDALKALLLPRATLLTPNLQEAATLGGLPLARERGDLSAQARALLALGPGAVLLKGGHLSGELSPDLYLDKTQEAWLEAPRVETRNQRGTGCALASAVAAFLAQGLELLPACRRAKAFLTRSLQASAQDAWTGAGPLRFVPEPLS